jgi:predicted DsbA family dithiol-disulfide isomerase
MIFAMSSRLLVDVVSDIICPWCFIGKRRLERAGEILGRPVEIHWHPFQLNPEIPVAGISRREYRTAKFGSWEYSQRLDARVAENGRQAGIEFRHDLMERTPNSFRGHVLLAAALRQGVDTQNQVAERLFTGYFTRGEDVGNLAVLSAIGRECGVDADVNDEVLAKAVKDEEAAVRELGVNGVPLITFGGRLVSEGAAPETSLAEILREFSESS